MQDIHEPTVTEQMLLSNIETPQVRIGERLSALDLLLVIANHRRPIFWSTIATAVITTVIVFLMPKIYTGESVILTPKPATSMSDLLDGQALLNGLSSGASLGLTDPNDVYVAMLKSRSIATDIIERFHLRDYYDDATMVETLKDLDKDTSISSGHDGTITIRYDHEDPKVAAAVANAYVEGLRKLTLDGAISAAEQRKQFFQQQFELTKKNLAAAEMAMRKSQENSGVLDLDKQAAFIVNMIADLRGRIGAQEILIRGMKASATDQNPDVIREKEQLATMRAQLAELERKHQGGDGDVFLATRNLPEKGLEFLRNLRDVKYYEAMFDVLGKQYEAAIMDAAGMPATIQVVDQAVAPDKKNKPKRSLIIAAATIGMFILSFAWFLTDDILSREAEDPENGPKVRVLRSVTGKSIRWVSDRRVFRRLKRGRRRGNTGSSETGV